MKIIRNILRRLQKPSPALPMGEAEKMSRRASRGHSGAISEPDHCQSCYTCEKGISPDVTVPMFREAKAKGQIPPSWFEEPESCEVCYHCEKCFSGQDGET
jgi:hypothetical protein